MSTRPERCARCEVAYGSGRPSYFASEPKCAFPNGVFASDNWNCATANLLRDAARQDEPDGHTVWSEDQNAALIPWDGVFVVMGWYKHRGRTEYIGVLGDSGCRLMTIGEADAYLADNPPPPSRPSPLTVALAMLAAESPADPNRPAGQLAREFPPPEPTP